MKESLNNDMSEVDIADIEEQKIVDKKYQDLEDTIVDDNLANQIEENDNDQ